MKLRLTYENTVLALKNAVALKGEDYVYKVSANTRGPACVYFGRDKQPSCIVGHLLAEMGVEPFAFNSKTNSSSVTALMSKGVLEVDDLDANFRSRTLELLAMTQNKQDNGIPWGRALEEGIDYANSLRASIPYALLFKKGLGK